MADSAILVADSATGEKDAKAKLVWAQGGVNRFFSWPATAGVMVGCEAADLGCWLQSVQGKRCFQPFRFLLDQQGWPLAKNQFDETPPMQMPGCFGHIFA